MLQLSERRSSNGHRDNRTASGHDPGFLSSSLASAIVLLSSFGLLVCWFVGFDRVKNWSAGTTALLSVRNPPAVAATIFRLTWTYPFRRRSIGAVNSENVKASVGLCCTAACWGRPKIVVFLYFKEYFEVSNDIKLTLLSSVPSFADLLPICYSCIFDVMADAVVSFANSVLELQRQYASARDHSSLGPEIGGLSCSAAIARMPPSMSSEPPPNAATTEQHSSPSPAANDPAADMAHISSTVGGSVVQDLMRVYESLTQSSTPQVTTEEPSSKPSAPPTTPAPINFGVPHHMSGHPYSPPGQLVAPPSNYPIPPPPMYHPHPGANFPPSQQHPAFANHQGFFADPTFSSQHPYPMPPSEHAPQHGGYVMPGHESQQQGAPSERDESEEAEGEHQHLQENSGRPKRKRRGSDSSSVRGQKGRKKSKAADGRWSKRFTWPEELHRDFVSAIFDVGLKHSSPSTILEHMPNHEQITTERIKSHLQKYRMHRVKSKKEFISSYEASLRKFKKRGVEDVQSAAGSEMAAHLSYSDMNNSSISAPEAPKPADAVPSDSKPKMEPLMLPQLSEAEKQSPIGSAMGYLMGLFFSLKQQLMIQRATAAAERKAEAPVQAVFNSFIAGSDPAGVPAAGAPQDGVDPSLDVNAQKPASQSVRSNIQENSIMKREMQSQMALQSKMRALKQQELNKYKNLPAHPGPEKVAESQTEPAADETRERLDAAEANRIQGAGEIDGNDDASSAVTRGQRSLSLGAPEEFWHTDVVDDQLFEFLMNN